MVNKLLVLRMNASFQENNICKGKRGVQEAPWILKAKIPYHYFNIFYNKLRLNFKECSRNDIHLSSFLRVSKNRFFLNNRIDLS